MMVRDGLRAFAVCTGCDAVGVLKGTGERLVGRETVLQGDIQNALIGIPQFLQCKGKFTASHIISKLHTGDFFEFFGEMKLGVAGEMPQR